MVESILSSVSVTLLEQGYQIGLNGLGKFAQAIIEGVGIIGWGIIVFTLVLKAITLPLDIYQRVKMRKQNLIMESMKEDLEKLQQQYANDKTAYNQKMMELYKKNGYSMFGACLPALVSIAIIIIAFQGFNAYSSYANLSMYEKMSEAYNAAILTDHAPDGIDLKIGETDDFESDTPTIIWQNERKQTIGNVSYEMYEVIKKEEGAEEQKQKYIRVSAVSEENNYFLSYSYWAEAERVSREYAIDTDKLTAYIQADADRIAAFDAIHAAAVEKGETTEGVHIDAEYNRYVVATGANAVADYYRSGHDARFLWVKNVWYPDVSYNHPIANFTSFNKQLGTKKVTLKSGEKVKLNTVLTDTNYNNLTQSLVKEKKQPNGYFILIILSIGLMVLSQFVTMRSSKDANKYQTVDGQGAKQQKIMLVLMPLIYAIFAFMYSAAFSIYMTVSSAISLVVTLLSNLVIGRIFKARAARKEEAMITRKYSWQMTEKEKQQQQKDAERERKAQEKAQRRNKKY